MRSLRKLLKSAGANCEDSTGFSTGGATVEDVDGPDMGVKASGGAFALMKDALAFIELVRRIRTSECSHHGKVKGGSCDY